MGDLRVWLPRPTGLSTDEIQSPSTSSLSSLSNPCLSSISSDSWSIAEQTTCGIICRIQPTVVSEQRRRAVVDYVQRLIRWNIGNEVFPFGSVPLKTYLPDGDIDLTAFGTQNVEEAANEVCSVLEAEEQNSTAEFEVKDVQYIHAEVKLVKCLVQNIVVDISFNQLGGLCTLCFLEQIDRLIGKDNLFKRSIILIKAWCYYESRILGAHHGLISTYALETLVLYIFHVFHTSLHGPIAVLYKFLDYYSKFDWDNYCVSLNGPVCVSSLPDTVVETPETDGCELLLTKDFLRQCIERFSVPSKGYESNSRSFPRKHLNIVDPLKEHNNLGRSVSKGNFYRIRSAFTYGARKLGRILLLPVESIPDELNKFFTNTLDRHGSGQRPDVQDIVSTCLDQNSTPFFNNGSGHAPPNAEFEKYVEDRTVSGASYVESSGSVWGSIDRNDVLCEEISNIRISEPEKKHGTTIQSGRQTFSHQPSGNELQRCIREDFSSTQSESDLSTEGNIISGSRLAGDAKDLATSRIPNLRITNETCKPLPSTSELLLPLPPSSKPLPLSYVKPNHAPHLFFSRSFSENGKNRDGDSDQSKRMSFSELENVVPFRPRASDEVIRHSLQPDANESLAAASLTDSSVVSSSGSAELLLRNQSLAKTNSFNRFEASSRDILVVGSRDCDSVGTTGSSETSDGLSELSGDYDCHLKNMQYGQWCHEHFLSGPVFPVPPPSPSQFYNKHSWDPLYRPLHMKRNLFPHMNANGVVPGPSFPPASAYYPPMNQPVVPGAFGVEEMPKPRGTGTYFPNTNHRQYRERISPGRGRNPVPVTQSQLQRPRGSGRAATMLPDTNFPEKGSQEMSQVHQHPVASGNSRGKPGDFLQAGLPFARGFLHANGFTVPPSERLEFLSFGSLQVGASSPESVRQPDSSSAPQTNPSMQRPGSSSSQERRYHLKDDTDFPPLSV